MAGEGEEGWDPHRMFEHYMHDYLVRKKMHRTAQVFKTEANIADYTVAINDPGEGFLHDWWRVFSKVYAERMRLGRGDGAAGSLTIGESTQQGCNNRAAGPPVAPIPQVPMQIPRSNRFDDILEKPAAISPEMLLPGPPSMNSPFGLNEADFSFPVLAPSSSTPPQTMEQLNYENPMNYLSDGLPMPQNRFSGTSDQLNLGPPSEWPRNAPNYQQQNQLFPVDLEQYRFSPINPSANYSVSMPNPILTNIGTTENNGQTESQKVQPQRPPRPNARKKKGPSNLTPKAGAKTEKGKSTVKTVNSTKTEDRAEDKKQGLNLEEIQCIRSSKHPLSCCDFSLDGKFLACAGSEGKVFIWNTDACYSASPTEQHSDPITDVRFQPNSSIFVTSSLDKTIKIWDAAEPNKIHPPRYGHKFPVVSLDFHPKKADLLCSCDSNDKIQIWNFKNSKKLHAFKIESPDVQLGATRQVRFQPGYATLIATASGNVVSLFDVDSSRLVSTLKGHIKDILSVTWDASGARILSVSEDSARMWSILSQNCIYELRAREKKFVSGTFHPKDQSLGIIGSYKSIEIWDPSNGGQTTLIRAHEGSITALAPAKQPMMVASVSNDCSVKLWKGRNNTL